MTNTNSITKLIDKVDINMYRYLYTASIAKEVASSGDGGNSFGIIIIGMIVVIVGMVGFIITKNNK